MPREEVDINQLIDFARKLDVFNTLVENNASMLRIKWRELIWRDRERERFDGEFVKNMKIISNFIEESKEQVKFLNKKAEEYTSAHH